jgi:hypothetical protein
MHSGVLGWWSDVCNLKRMFAFFVLFEYFDKGSSFCLLFLCVDRECNRPSFLVKVFQNAIAFNGDLSQWDIASVSDMNGSKSILIVENDLT